VNEVSMLNIGGVTITRNPKCSKRKPQPNASLYTICNIWTGLGTATGGLILEVIEIQAN
jgi:hypothetical protein